jgi:hypothetical protein
MSIEVQDFDIVTARRVAKVCPKIVQDYIKFLEKNYLNQERLTILALKKIRELTKKEE